MDTEHSMAPTPEQSSERVELIPRNRPELSQRLPIAALVIKKELMRAQTKILSKVITPFESKLGSGRPDLRRMTSTSRPARNLPAGTDRGDSLGLVVPNTRLAVVDGTEKDPATTVCRDILFFHPDGGPPSIDR
jgi:hypothetical protein